MSENNNNNGVSVTPRYEKPTDELRQVVSNAMAMRYKGKSTPFPIVQSVQRKWMVQDGERFYSVLGPIEGYSVCVSDGYYLTNNQLAGLEPIDLSSLDNPTDIKTKPVYVKIKPEWRDLPMVDESGKSITQSQ